MKLQAKLCLGMATTVALAIGVTCWYLIRAHEDSMLLDAQKRSLAIAGAAEAARDHVAQMHQQGAIDAVVVPAGWPPQPAGGESGR
jgi:hypothetical protein